MNIWFGEKAKSEFSPPFVEGELTVREMLADPIVICLMKRDGISHANVIDLFKNEPKECLCLAA